MPIETRKKLSKPPFQKVSPAAATNISEGIFREMRRKFPWRPSSWLWSAQFTLHEEGRHDNEDGRQRDEDGRHGRAAGLPETGLFIRSIFLHHPQAGSGYSTLRKLRFSGLSRKTRFGLTKTHVPETNRADVLSARHKMFRPAYKKTTRKGSVFGLK